MAFLDWVKSLLGGEKHDIDIIQKYQDLEAELIVQVLAFESAINLISNALVKCEVKTFVGDEEIKGIEWHRWNVEPNQNQSADKFYCSLVRQLYLTNECLIVPTKTGMYVADRFSKNCQVETEDFYTDVSVRGIELDRTFSESEVMYITLNSSNSYKVVEKMYSSYGKLITYAQKYYRSSKGRKGILKVEAIATNKKNWEENFKTLMNERFRAYFESDNAVLPLFDGYEYQEQDSKTYSNEGTRDIRAMIDDVFDFTARGFSIPPILLKGELADSENAVKNFLSFCIDPLALRIEKETSRKAHSKKEMTQGNYYKVDTSKVEHFSLFDLSVAVDKLISSGAFTINEIRKKMNEKEISEPFANKHYITKNYTEIEKLTEVQNE